jgi:voltage-gated potassium channel
MKLRADWLRWRRTVHDVLEVGTEANRAALFVDGFIITLIVANAIAFTLETVKGIAARYGTALDHFNTFSVIVFSIEYTLRLWSSVDIPLFRGVPHWKARLRFAGRPIMLIDMMAILPWYLHGILPVDLRILRVLRLFRLLKLARYSPALQSLQKVFAQEWRALFGALLVTLVLLLFCSTIMYFLEGTAQPDKFGSIPAALWWGLETLTTVGYGDAVPVTPLGRMFGGIVMLLGLAAIALPVAIIATGFSQESGRHEFVVTWGMIARVPLFASLDAAEVAEVAKLVYARVFAPGASIVSAGDAGGAMYIIERGEAVVTPARGHKPTLGPGDFFGEMALLEHRRHQHDVVAKSACRIYVLDSMALAQLERRHPEILKMIRDVAASRENTDLAAVKAAKGLGSRKRRDVST